MLTYVSAEKVPDYITLRFLSKCTPANDFTRLCGSASTFAWTGLPSSSQGTYSRSTLTSRTSKTYSATSNGEWGQKQPKTSSTRHVDAHPLFHPCRRPAKKNSDDSIGNGHGEYATTGGGRQLGSSVNGTDPLPSISIFTTATSTTPLLGGTRIEALPSQIQQKQSGPSTLVRMGRDSQL